MGFEADRIKLTPGILCMHTCQIHMLPHQGQLLKSPYQSTEEDKKHTVLAIQVVAVMESACWRNYSNVVNDISAGPSSGGVT